MGPGSRLLSLALHTYSFHVSCSLGHCWRALRLPGLVTTQLHRACPLGSEIVKKTLARQGLAFSMCIYIYTLIYTCVCVYVRMRLHQSNSQSSPKSVGWEASVIICALLFIIMPSPLPAPILSALRHPPANPGDKSSFLDLENHPIQPFRLPPVVSRRFGSGS